MTEHMSLPVVQVGEPAPDAMLRDENGNEVTLSSFWQRQPTAFVFVRHYG